MLTRVAVVALNTYREAVRARILLGLFALALGTGGYALVVGAYANRSRLRVVSDLGAASISIYAIAVAIVLGATSLYRELELKTIFPILARPIRRAEYLVGKLLGTVLTLAVFIAINGGSLLLAIAVLSGRPLLPIAYGVLAGAVAVGLLAWRRPRLQSYLPILCAVVLGLAGFVLAGGAPDDRSVIAGSAALTLCEILVIASAATLFSAFSSPFLTAVFTLAVFIVGRSADALGRLPEKMFGAFIHGLGAVVAKVVPNLMWYVPPRSLLTGEAAGESLSTHLALSAGYAVCWAVGLLTLAAIVFKRRDFL
ncbi:MAG TPA: ABC transporter permease subunit [Polyangiaceae bacterium]|jgi:ABC-type transport system involved in multi-copper enzyme maturation permease subunit|nr:ABC transporter permease subunit [Polyangiaceae bacterium]